MTRPEDAIRKRAMWLYKVMGGDRDNWEKESEAFRSEYLTLARRLEEQRPTKGKGKPIEDTDPRWRKPVEIWCPDCRKYLPLDGEQVGSFLRNHRRSEHGSER